MSMFFGIVQSNKKQLGQNYLNGKVAYIKQPGDPGYDALIQHGYVISSVNVATSASWGCSGTDIGVYDQGLDTGQYQTDSIWSTCSTPLIAAIQAYDYNGEQGNWWLPSENEFIACWNNRAAFGGLSATYYWTCTEDTSTTARAVLATTGGATAASKNSGYYVRAIRAF